MRRGNDTMVDDGGTGFSTPATSESTAGETCGFDWFEYYGSRNVYRATFDPETYRPTTAVVEAVATVDGTTATDVGPLQGVVDGDAIDRILTAPSADETVRIRFFFHGYDVVVDGGGNLTVLAPGATDDE